MNPFRSAICSVISILSLTGCISNAPSCHSEEIEKLELLGKKADDPRLKKAVRYTLRNMENKYSVSGRLNNDYFSDFIDSIENTQGHISYLNAHDYSKSDRPKHGCKSYIVSPDKDEIDAESLRENIVMALNAWDNAAWKDKYDERIFYKYILPYRLSLEPIDFSWREAAYNDYHPLLANKGADDPLKACKIINDKIIYLHYDLLRAADLQTYASYKSAPRGGCEGRALYTAMIMRSLGLPVAIDFVPIWGCVNNGHTFNSLIMPDGKNIGFSVPKDLPDGGIMAWKCTKVYRRCFEIQKDSPIYKYRNKEPIAEPFSNYDIEDVTSAYDIPTRNVEIDKPRSGINRRLAYLAAPRRDKWNVLAYGERKRGKYIFENIGYGYQNGVDIEKQGENLGDGIVYLPLQFDDSNNLSPIDYPFILSDTGIRRLNPDTSDLREVVLTRKYPRFARIVSFAESTERYIFEGANKPDFSDAEVLHVITSTPSSRLQRFDVNSAKKYKYARVRNILGGLMIGELAFCDEDGNIIDGKTINHKLLDGEPTLANVFDGDVLSFMKFDENIYNLWLGTEFNRPQRIGSIAFCPRTDDNDIKPGDIYELLYWDNDWISLGTQIAEDYRLKYYDVPSNTLLLLRNHSRGKEERPFTFENGRQIWW